MFEDRGGYHGIRGNLYNTTGGRHKMLPAAEALDAVHAIQETAWTVNLKVLEFVDWLQGEGSESPLGFSKHAETGVKLTRDEFGALSKGEKREIVHQNAERKARKAKRAAIESRVGLVREIAETGSEFYQPMFLDFRGRVYPKNSMFNNQADHWSKGLMMFSEGTALRDTGLNSLKIHTATTWGHDKLQLEDRIQWVDDNLEMLTAVAESYEYASEALVSADEPLAAYAATIDVVRAINAPEPPEYVSRIPCAIDGTCNGLQILSLLGHDAVGADKTNCTSNPVRQDVYMEVADIALKLVEADLTNEDPIETKDAEDQVIKLETQEVASVWFEHLQDKNARRKAVKRAIMTTAYGVSENTIKNNLCDDGIVDKLQIPESFDVIPTNRCRQVFATYMRNKIVEAREGAIQAAVKIMDYFHDVAGTLAREGVSMSWTTPDGLVVKQDYRKTEEKRYLSIDTGKLTIQEMTNTVDPRKCASGAAPQVVHSLDAAMLRMVARRLNLAGISEMAMIHDSYGVAAGHIDTLHTILREVAVEIFGGDWLRDVFHAEQMQHGVELPEPPAQGDLDVAVEIPKATYFFS